MSKRSPSSSRHYSSSSSSSSSSSHKRSKRDQNEYSASKKADREAQLEEEMRKRKERIEKWRIEKEKMDNEKSRPISTTDVAVDSSTDASGMGPVDLSKIKIPTSSLKASSSAAFATDDDMFEIPIPGQAGGGKSRLEKHLADEESDVSQVSQANEDNDEDPLDAFMKTLGSESNSKSKEKTAPPSQPTAKSVVIMSGVARSSQLTTDSNANSKRQILNNDYDDTSQVVEEVAEEEDLETTMKRIENQNRKDIVQIDHNKIVYEPFTRKFYTPVPEIQNMTDAEVEEYRIELGGVRVRGRDVPRPVKTWPQCGLNPKVLLMLERMEFDKPTPIQAQGVPVIMSGFDVIGIAKTGSGKTLAFVLPMVRHIAAQRLVEQGEGPIAIILTPTRELCTQIGKDVKLLMRAVKGARVACIYGGTGISDQIALLKRGAEVIVCTPGRMIEMMAVNSGRVTNMQRVTYIVLDEADRMFDMGFEPQVMRIIDNCRPDRQLVMFSATFPRQMEALARRILRRPAEVAVGGKSIVAKEVRQHVHMVADDDKFLKLLQILGAKLSRENDAEDKRALIFVDRQEHADAVLKDLMAASYTASASLHGGIDQIDRQSIIANFKSGKFRILVATSVCARGLDVKELVLVVNYNCPNHYEDYVHRCGRTGRAGNSGDAHTFMTKDDARYAIDLIKAHELSETLVPAELRQMWKEFKASMEAQGKKVRETGRSGGFGGSGFKFDETESNFSSDKKNFEKTVFGLQDSDDEDMEQKLDDQIETMLSSKRTVKMMTAAEVAAASSAKFNNNAKQGPGSGGEAGGNGSAQASDAQDQPQQGNGSESQGKEGAGAVDQAVSDAKSSACVAERLELAKKLASKITMKSTAQARANIENAEAYLAGRSTSTDVAAPERLTSKSLADTLAKRLNAKLHYTPSLKDDQEEEESVAMDPVTGLPLNQDHMLETFEEELSINDFPQLARWRVTSRDMLAQICEYSEAGVTVRGTYFAPKKPVPEGERKLYLKIEAFSEIAVQKAKVEITRILREELLKYRASGMNHASKARYRIL